MNTIQPINAYNATHNQSFKEIIESLSSGKRNQDAADISITGRMLSQLNGTLTARRNVSDGISLAETSGSALSGVSENIQRIREITVQAGNSTLSNSDRAALQTEADTLSAEISRVVSTTNFNGVKTLSSDSTLQFQVGPNAGDTVTLRTTDISEDLNVTVDLSDPANTEANLNELDAALTATATAQVEFGSISNRLESTSKSLDQSQISISAGLSSRSDTDYASATAELTQTLILKQTGIAIQAQANASAELILLLLD